MPHYLGAFALHSYNPIILDQQLGFDSDNLEFIKSIQNENLDYRVHRLPDMGGRLQVLVCL
jgi:hypothetical protein